jgi:hypothetical protein
VWVRIADATTQTNNHASGWVRFNDMAAGEAWHWDEVHSSDDNNTVVRWTLAPGTHTLEIAYREAGAQVDVIEIHAELSGVDQGFAGLAALRAYLGRACDAPRQA